MRVNYVPYSVYVKIRDSLAEIHLSVDDAIMYLILYMSRNKAVEPYENDPLHHRAVRVVEEFVKTNYQSEYDSLGKKKLPYGKELALLLALVEAGYISFDEEGNLLLGGKPYRSVVNKVLEGKDAERVYNTTVIKLLDIMRVVDDTQLYEKLVGKPGVIRILLKSPNLIDVSVLTARYKGRPVWESLPNDLKREVAQKAPAHTLALMLEEYRNIKREDALMIIEALARKAPDLAGQLSLVHAPEIHGVGRDAKIVKVGSMVGVDMGGYIVAPVILPDIHSKTGRWYIVFSKKDKLGVPVKAGTIQEALHKYEEYREKTLEEIPKLKNTTRVRVYTAKIGDYQLTMAVIPENDYPIPVYPGMSEDLKSSGKKKSELLEYIL